MDVLDAPATTTTSCTSWCRCSIGRGSEWEPADEARPGARRARTRTVVLIDSQLLLLIVPILLIQVGLIVLALRDLLRPDRHVRGESKLVWGLVIVIVNIIGPLLYFAVGRREA